MKKIYTKPEMAVTSFEADNIMKVSSADVQSSFDAIDYSTIQSGTLN